MGIDEGDEEGLMLTGASTAHIVELWLVVRIGAPGGRKSIGRQRCHTSAIIQEIRPAMKVARVGERLIRRDRCKGACVWRG